MNQIQSLSGPSTLAWRSEGPTVKSAPNWGFVGCCLFCRVRVSDVMLQQKLRKAGQRQTKPASRQVAKDEGGLPARNVHLVVPCPGTADADDWITLKPLPQ